MKILVLNCGSSSVKFQLLNMEGEKALARGIVEKIGEEGSRIRFSAGSDLIDEVKVYDHDMAIRLVFDHLMHSGHGVIGSTEEIDAIGHRVVHGGERFSESTLIDDEVLETIRNCCRFAPLHNPHNLKGIEVCTRQVPSADQVGVFDTAFHNRMPPEAYLYALPYSVYERLGIRRYGFHGTSHHYVASRAAEILARPLDKIRLVSCHLGNGASVAAVRNGISVDTSMGFTPLEGLVMGTRCGDLDPAILLYLLEREGLTTAELDTLLNKKSGLLGLTGDTNDMRKIEERFEDGSERHRLALFVFVRRVKKYIGAYTALLGGVDALIFTGGIGENSSLVRQLAVEGLEFMGLNIDEARNRGDEVRVSADPGSGRPSILVIPTNEELAIARDTAQVVTGIRSDG